MRILHKSILYFSVVALSGLIWAGYCARLTRRVLVLSEQHRLSVDLIRHLGEMQVMAHNYLHHNESLLQAPWRTQYEESAAMIESMRQSSVATRQIEHLNEAILRLGKAFSRAEEFNVDLYRVMNAEQKEEWIRHLGGQLAAESQRAMAMVSLYSAKLDADTLLYERRLRTLFVAAVGLLIFALFTMILALQHWGLRPLVELLRGVQRVAAGDLNQRIPILRPDEFGEVTQAFNEMTETLSRVTASRDDLDREVRERRKTEQALEQSNRDLQQFAYVASHDLQEPLRMVTSFVQLLESRYQDQLDEDGREFIAFAVEGAQRMQQLIQDLLEYSRVSSQGKALSPVSLSAVLAEALDNLRTRLVDGGKVEFESMPEVLGDSAQLVRLFQNLIGNALKFAHPDRLPVVRIDAEECGSEVYVSVRDNGIGIAPEHQAKVFVIFQRLQGREKYEGNGMGLAICKRIVERHGGAITLESKPNEGTVFTIRLQRVKEGGIDAKTAG